MISAWPRPIPVPNSARPASPTSVVVNGSKYWNSLIAPDGVASSRYQTP